MGGGGGSMGDEGEGNDEEEEKIDKASQEICLNQFQMSKKLLIKKKILIEFY